jgi:hypothetical protein
MKQQAKNTESNFDELCDKIAQGKASPTEIKSAFQNLNNDIETFNSDIEDQLNKTKN